MEVKWLHSQVEVVRLLVHQGAVGLVVRESWSFLHALAHLFPTALEGERAALALRESNVPLGSPGFQTSTAS